MPPKPKFKTIIHTYLPPTPTSVWDPESLPFLPLFTPIDGAPGLLWGHALCPFFKQRAPSSGVKKKCSQRPLISVSQLPGEIE